MRMLYKGMEVVADSYVPMYFAAARWEIFKWRWFWRFFGREYPHGEKMILVMDLPGEHRSIAVVNPAVYAEIARELTAVVN